MKKLLSYLIIVLLLACSNEVPEKPTPVPTPVDNDFLTTNVSTIRTGYPAGGDEYKISSNIPWEITWKAPWLSVTPTSGEGNGSFRISWTENDWTYDREDTIYISGKKKQDKFPVYQLHKADSAHIVSYRAIIGNMVKGESDSIEVIFDKPTKVTKYVLDDGLIEIIPPPNVSSTMFKLMVGYLGAGHELKLHLEFASLSDGTESKKEITIPFYQKRFPLEVDGEAIRHSVLAEDEQSVWVSVTSQVTKQHRVMQISLDDCSVMKSVDLPFGPRHLCINPYNHLLYVLPYNGDADIGNSDTFCVIDPKDGKILKTIKIEQSPKAHHQHPTNYPDELEFTKDGLGILLLMSPSSTLREWRYIDSANDDKITLSGYDWSEFIFEHVYQNYDRSRIYTSEDPRSYHHICYISRQHPTPITLTTHSTFESDKYYAGGNLVDLRMSPFANKAFICTAPGSQCVVNLEPLGYSEVTEEEARGAKCAWDANSPDRDLVYQVCPTTLSTTSPIRLLELFDMTKGEVLLATCHEFSVHNNVVNCHYRKSTDHLVVISWRGVYLLDAADMKKRSK